MNEVDCQRLQNYLNYEFNNRKYVKTALTHSSYANETKGRYQSNERLEFLGDAVLSIVVSDHIFRNCPALPEGDLTKLRAHLVCEKTLYEFAKSVHIGEFLMLSYGEKKNKGNERHSILADAFEAMIAAIYLDGGLDKAQEFILRFILPEVANSAIKNLNDYKSMLQEIVQRNPESSLDYILIGEEGPDHSKKFWMKVCLNNQTIGKGEGKSKKEAEQQAAKAALEQMGYELK
ncbi:MAG: ribonuclease III [Oscillospiraceae bacterium]|nr:ribonuclease III [Oscillospiraceae bacterium]